MHVFVHLCLECVYGLDIIDDALLTTFKGELSAVIPKAIQPFPFPSILKSIKSPFFLHAT